MQYNVVSPGGLCGKNRFWLMESHAPKFHITTSKSRFYKFVVIIFHNIIVHNIILTTDFRVDQNSIKWLSITCVTNKFYWIAAVNELSNNFFFCWPKITRDMLRNEIFEMCMLCIYYRSIESDAINSNAFVHISASIFCAVIECRTIEAVKSEYGHVIIITHSFAEFVKASSC